MDESNTAVIVGNDVELWSISRTANGFSCLRTIYVGAAAKARAAIGSTEEDTSRDDTASSNAVLDSLSIGRPSASIARNVPRTSPAIAFFAGEHTTNEALVRRAERLVAYVSTIRDSLRRS